MMHSRFLIIAALFTNIFCASAADAKRKPSDPNYILDFPGTLTVRTYLGEKISTFRLVDDTRSQNLQFRPNNNLSLGVGVTIKGIGLNVSTRLPFHDLKEEKYGDTRRLDIQVHRYRGKMAFDIYAQRYRGFHLNDKGIVRDVYGPTEYPYYPNLQSLTFGGQFMYLFNGQSYSLRAMVNQQEWQVRSAGSFMLGGAVFTHLLSNDDSAVVPTNLRTPEFLDSTLIKNVTSYGGTLNAGYGYNFVFRRNWFISFSGDIGAGICRTETSHLDGNKDAINGLLINTNGRFGAGYNSRKVFAGFYTIYRTDIAPLPFGDSRLRISEGLFRIVVARRLVTNRAKAAASPTSANQ